MKITQEDTPEIYKVLLDGTETAQKIGSNPKRYYMRRRPFMRFNEPTLYPQDDDELRHNGSYPSGHTILGWSAALLMMEINPDRANEILARGYRYGENRVVVGAHWQSDTDAARLAASAAYARLHTSDRFLEQMRKAREEFKAKSAPSAVRQTRAAQNASAAIYDLSGKRVTTPQNNIYIQNGKKQVMR
jgi:acid phosphatase (class A)